MFYLKWKKCINYFKKKIPQSEFNMWIRPLQPKIKKKNFFLYTPNNFFLLWIKEKYLKKIKILVKKYFNIKSSHIKLIINKKIIQISKNYNIKKNENNQENVLKKYKFKNFIIGKSNKLAYQSAYHIAQNPGNFYNPFFLYGKTGLGKTHLLYAIKNSLEKKKYQKIIYIKSEHFVQKMVKSLKNNSIEKFKKYYRSANILIIEDIQFFSYKNRTQEEFFYTIYDLIEKNKQIIITSNCYPTKMKGINERLQSRLDSGLSVCINTPTKNTRIKILIKKSHEKNIFLPYRIIYFIANNFKSNVRELESILNKIQANLLFNKHKNITINLIKKILKDFLQVKKKKITIKKIQKIVSKHYNIKLSELLSIKKNKSIILPRQIAMTLSKNLTKHSLQEIGNFFNKKTHTTVLYACKKIKKLYNKNLIIQKNYNILLKKLSV
ncbi:chromosomal replication initiator protein DnaA [Buchnera aphidicola]|uniref:chromosomal replication initiator protein DnaA n=1 Tax=Buchnera aphidicola TaxID=9 RepID=UPI0020926D02|nr:chromosomal replication initiator protein DnaA [Buchnera aphidicola]USS94146.1 chromosomal replication initiator protein DnaA [Buchnera aphidicola (Sipha maydis)]WII23694.1 chromosomal replication initiator protein DnaA [Buchnera aphidicola (Sipha maydis)]